MSSFHVMEEKFGRYCFLRWWRTLGVRRVCWIILNASLSADIGDWLCIPMSFFIMNSSNSSSDWICAGNPGASICFRPSWGSGVGSGWAFAERTNSIEAAAEKPECWQCVLLRGIHNPSNVRSRTNFRWLIYVPKSFSKLRIWLACTWGRARCVS